MFTIMLIVNLLHFEEIPIQKRRLTYNRANPNNSSITTISNDHLSNQSKTGSTSSNQLAVNPSFTSLSMSQNFQNGASNEGTSPESVNIARYVANRSVLDLATLTLGEMQVLCTLKPNQIGVTVSLFIVYAFCNSLAVLETVMLPMILQDEDFEHTVHSHIAYPLLACLSVTSALSFFIYRRFIDHQALPLISDRSFIFVSIILGFSGCAMLLRSHGINLLSTVGFSLIGISLVIGIKSLASMYTKIVGVAFGSTKISESGTVQLYDRQRDVGWYLGIAMTCSVISRMVTPLFNTFLLLQGGPTAIFISMMVLYTLSFILLVTKMSSLQPHYSYMIVKQKEMVTRGINEKDVRLLDTVEYIASSQSYIP